jgi:hypothetical protein
MSLLGTTSSEGRPAMQISRRAHVVQSSDSMHIVIGPDRRWLARLSALLRVVVFSAPVALVFRATMIGHRPSLGVLAVNGLFVTLATWVARDTLWKLFGWEEFTLNKETLTLTTRLLGVQRAKSFSVAAVRGLRCREQRGAHHLVRRTIVFQCDGEAVSSVRQLTKEEGQRLVAGPLRELARQ